MNNSRIRDYARIKKVSHWRIAERLGISESAFCKKLRKQFTEEQEEKVMRIIDEIALQK